MIFFGIVIGLFIATACFKAYSVFNSDSDCITHREYYYYTREAVERYNEISKYFSAHQSELKLISLKYNDAHSMFNFGYENNIVVKYKLIDNDFKVNF